MFWIQYHFNFQFLLLLFDSNLVFLYLLATVSCLFIVLNLVTFPITSSCSYCPLYSNLVTFHHYCCTCLFQFQLGIVLLLPRTILIEFSCWLLLLDLYYTIQSKSLLLRICMVLVAAGFKLVIIQIGFLPISWTVADSCWSGFLFISSFHQLTGFVHFAYIDSYFVCFKLSVSMMMNVMNKSLIIIITIMSE